MQDETDYRVLELMFMFEELEDTILDYVNSNTGIKGVELVLKVMSKMMPKTFQTSEYLEILQNLVNRGEIVELEYEVPQVKDRIKSIYFPKGTTFKK